MVGTPIKRARREAQLAMQKRAAEQLADLYILPDGAEASGESETERVVSPVPLVDPAALPVKSKRGLLDPSERPMVPSVEAQRVVFELAVAGLPQERIAVYLGVSETVLRKYYRQELDSALEEMLGRITMSLATKALLGDTTAQMFFLERRGGAPWKRQKETVELTSKSTLDVNIKQELVTKILAIVDSREKPIDGQKLVDNIIDASPTAETKLPKHPP